MAALRVSRFPAPTRLRRTGSHKYHFEIFGMTRPGIEPQPSSLVASAQPTVSLSRGCVAVLISDLNIRTENVDA